MSTSLTVFIRALEHLEACDRSGQTQCIRPALSVVLDMSRAFRKYELGLCQKLHLSKITRRNYLCALQIDYWCFARTTILYYSFGSFLGICFEIIFNILKLFCLDCE